jgi:hypothetical protein
MDWWRGSRRPHLEACLKDRRRAVRILLRKQGWRLEWRRVSKISNSDMTSFEDYHEKGRAVGLDEGPLGNTSSI